MDGQPHGRGRGDAGMDVSLSEGRVGGASGDKVDGCSGGLMKMSVCGKKEISVSYL